MGTGGMGWSKRRSRQQKLSSLLEVGTMVSSGISCRQCLALHSLALLRALWAPRYHSLCWAALHSTWLKDSLAWNQHLLSWSRVCRLIRVWPTQILLLGCWVCLRLWLQLAMAPGCEFGSQMILCSISGPKLGSIAAQSLQMVGYHNIGGKNLNII